MSLSHVILLKVVLCPLPSCFRTMFHMIEFEETLTEKETEAKGIRDVE